MFKREPYEKKKLRWRKAALKRCFGITPEDVARMREEQSGACGMCKKQFGDKPNDKPHVDHDHKTGKVRGLLCFRCNVALGYIEQNAEAASDYLRRSA